MSKVCLGKPEPCIANLMIGVATGFSSERLQSSLNRHWTLDVGLWTRLLDVPCHKPESIFPWIHACRSAWLKGAHAPRVPVYRAGPRRYRAGVLQTSGAG